MWNPTIAYLLVLYVISFFEDKIASLLAVRHEPHIQVVDNNLGGCFPPFKKYAPPIHILMARSPKKELFSRMYSLKLGLIPRLSALLK